MCKLTHLVHNPCYSYHDDVAVVDQTIAKAINAYVQATNGK